MDYETKREEKRGKIYGVDRGADGTIRKVTHLFWEHMYS